MCVLWPWAPRGRARGCQRLPGIWVQGHMGARRGQLGTGACAHDHGELLSVDSVASSAGEPGESPDSLPSSDPGPRPFQQPDAPPAVPLPRRPPGLVEPAFYPPATAPPEPGSSPRLAVDLALPGALPEELPLIASRVDVNGEAEEVVAPAQVALSVTEFGLLGIGDVNPFLAARPACPAPGLHSEPLSHCNVMTC